MQSDSVVRRLSAIYDRVDMTTRLLRVVEPFVSKTSDGSRRLTLVNLIVGATDERIRAMAQARRILESERAHIEREVGPERAADYFAQMEAREATERTVEAMWRDMLTGQVIAFPLSSA